MRVKARLGMGKVKFKLDFMFSINFFTLFDVSYIFLNISIRPGVMECFDVCNILDNKLSDWLQKICVNNNFKCFVRYQLPVGEDFTFAHCLYTF
jgi:hypothetical protein